jgi:hypothetical protein
MDDQLQLKMTKRFERDEDDESRVRPAYINSIDLMRIGAEVFMDTCIMPADDFARAKENQGSGNAHEIEVIVLDRFVFGLDTFQRLYAAVQVIHTDLSKIGALPSDATFRTETK